MASHLGPQLNIIGRGREQARLRDLLDRLLDGSGGLVLVSGEAGIGKTTLVEDLISQRDSHDVLTLTGACYDLTNSPPYGLWSELLRNYQPAESQATLPELFVVPSGFERSVNQAQIFEEARQFFLRLSDIQPLLIILEDIHWADELSIVALRYLARSLVDFRVLIVATYREDEPVRNQHFNELLPLLIREGRAERIELVRWEKAGTGSLIDGWYRLSRQDRERLSDYIHELAEGNPFYSVELLRTLEIERTLSRLANEWQLGDLSQRQLPRLVQLVIEQRLSCLTEDTRRLLEQASVIGQQVSVDLLLILSGVGSEKLDLAIAEAIEANIIKRTLNGSEFEFQHALIRESLYNSLPTLRSTSAHQTIAEAMIARNSADPDIVAHHFRSAGDDRALSWLLKAGLRARRSAAWIAAIDRFEQAASMLNGDDDELRNRGWLLLYCGFIGRYIGNTQRIDAFLDEAEGIANLSGDQELSARVRWHRGVFRCHRGDLGHGLSDMEEAVRTFERAGLVEYLPAFDERIQAVIKSLLQEDGSAQSAARPTEQSELPAAAKRPEMDLYSGPLANWYGQAGRLQESFAAAEHLGFDESNTGSHERGRRTPFGSGYYGLGLSYASLGKLTNSRRSFALGRWAAMEDGDYWAAGLASFVELFHVVLPLAPDRLDWRDRQVTETAEYLSKAGDLAAGADRVNPSEVAVNLVVGEWKAARQALAQLDSQPNPPPVLSALVAVGLGTIERYQGRPERAWQHIHAFLPSGLASEPGTRLFLSSQMLQRLAVNLALDSGDVETAEAWLEAHDRWLSWSGAVLGQADGKLLQTRLHYQCGRTELARERASEALQLASEPRQPLVIPEICRFLARLNIENGAFEQAARRLKTARRIADQCQAVYELALVRLAEAELAEAMDEPVLATEHLKMASHVLNNLEAQPALERVKNLDARLSQRSNKHPAGLTARELEILRLVGGGLTDADIADQLYISPRTVNRHLNNIYNKIDLHSRAAAVLWAAEEGLI